jgi:hypothetical protein
VCEPSRCQIEASLLLQPVTACLFYISLPVLPRPFPSRRAGTAFWFTQIIEELFNIHFKKDFKCAEFLHKPERRVLAFNQTGPYSLGSSYIRVQFI